MDARKIKPATIFQDKAIGRNSYPISKVVIGSAVLNGGIGQQTETHAGAGGVNRVRAVIAGGAVSERATMKSANPRGGRSSACVAGSRAISKRRTGPCIDPIKEPGIRVGRAVGENTGFAGGDTVRRGVVTGDAVV